MNRTKILFSIAALLALAGCNKELAPMGAEMTVEASVSALTKVSADGSAFTTGDQIAVYAWLGSATKNPTTRVVDGVVNTFDGSKWMPATMMRWQVTNDPHYFLGVYPASRAAASDFTAVPYTITGSAAADDLLLATTPAGVTNTGAAVQLGFHHTMARLDVNLRFRNEWTSVPSADHVSVSVEAKRSASVNYLTETVTPSGTAGNVALAPATAATDYALGYSGIQVPQDGVKKIIVEVDGFEYVFASANDIPLTSGKYTTLNLVLGKDKLELACVSVSDWTATTLSGVEADPTWALATPLTIEAKEAGARVNFYIATGVATNPVYYRTHDGVAWSDWAEYLNGATVTLANAGDKVQFKGDNARYANGGAFFPSFFGFSKDCYVYGNIMSLITSTDYSICTTLTATYAFQNLFSFNEHILSHPTQEFLLPASTLSDFCYYGMFQYSSLTSSPKLPAMNLAKGCYEDMFHGCASLTTAPTALPATTLEDSCYEGMFSGCTNLETAPAISAITMAKNSCKSMFSKCTSLKTVPDLSVTTMADFCSELMFYYCTSLETAPKISAITMAEGSCRSMFTGCTSLKNVPDLPATTMAMESCSYMFSFCTSLKTAPKLAAKTLATDCCAFMFYMCTSLTTIPANMLPADTMQSGCYRSMFADCSSLKIVPETMLPAKTLANSCYTGMFNNCSSLTATPALPATELAESCYTSMFFGCTSMITVPVLPSENMKTRCYMAMFENCTSLTTIPTGMLPATVLTTYCYSYMFSGCISLSTVPNDLLPAINLGKGCYLSMFNGCTSLTTGPILPAEKLVSECYEEMFASCSSLSSVTCLAKQGFDTNPKTDWLKGVAATGTLFHVTDPDEYNGDVPSGWTLSLYTP